jgi:hypothetical protein
MPRTHIETRSISRRGEFSTIEELSTVTGGKTGNSRFFYKKRKVLGYPWKVKDVQYK